MKLPQETSQALTRFIVFATFLVVLCHADDVLWYKGSFARYFGGAFSDANVCNFFLVSGFLLARHFGEAGWYKKAVASRISTLVLPYFVWNTLIALWMGDFRTALAEPTIAMKCLRVLGLYGILPWEWPAIFPMWYIRSLFLFVLVSPLAFRYSLRSKWTFLATAAVPLAYVVFSGLHPAVFVDWVEWFFHPVGFVYFIAGAGCAIYAKEFPDRLKRIPAIVPLAIWIASSAAVFMLGTESFLAKSHIASLLNAAVEVFSLLWISFSLKLRGPLLDALASSVFFIYAAHYHLLGLVKKFAVPVRFGEAVDFCVAAIGAVAISAALAQLLQRFAPHLAALLSGGRVARKVASRHETK